MRTLLIVTGMICSLSFFAAAGYSQNLYPLLPSPGNGGMKIDKMTIDPMKSDGMAMDGMKTDGMTVDQQKTDGMKMD